jgi:hypothetical protein
VFAIDGSKTSLFFPLVLWGTAFTIRYAPITPLRLVACLLLIFSVSYALNLKELHVHALRRLVCHPMLNIFFYFEYFPTSGFLWGVDLSIVSKMFHGVSPQLGPGMRVGLNYYGDSEMNVNANMMSVGFAEAGALGAWCIAILGFGVLMLFEMVLARAPAALGVLLAIPMAMCLCEQGLHTALLSGGVTALLFLVLVTHPDPSRSKAAAGSSFQTLNLGVIRR